MSLLKLRPNELETVLKLKGVHRTLSLLCERTGYSLKLTNDVLYKLVQLRNHKFKSVLYNELPASISEYLNKVIRETKTEINLQVLSTYNSPEWVSQVISESKHYTSCLSFGLLAAISKEKRNLPSWVNLLNWVRSDEDVSTVYRALLPKSTERLDGFTESYLASFKELVGYEAGCNRHYLKDELEAFKEDDVRYVVFGSPYDFRDPESTGYKGRARLIRYGDYWVMDTIYGNLGVSRTKVMNWLVEEEGYNLLVEKDTVDGRSFGEPNNEDIYVNEEITPNTVYKCEPVDYTGKVVYNTLRLLGNEQIPIKSIGHKHEHNEGSSRYSYTIFRNVIGSRMCTLRFINVANELIPGAVTMNTLQRTFSVNHVAGDYQLELVREGVIKLTKYEGEQKCHVTVNYNSAFIVCDGHKVAYSSYEDFLRRYLHNGPYYRVFTRLVKQFIHSL